MSAPRNPASTSLLTSQALVLRPEKLLIMQVVALSDLHGMRSRFEKARRLLDQGIEALLLGGDIAQNGSPEFQQANVRACFDILLSGKREVRIFAIPGNDDWKIVSLRRIAL